MALPDQRVWRFFEGRDFFRGRFFADFDKRLEAHLAMMVEARASRDDVTMMTFSLNPRR